MKDAADRARVQQILLADLKQDPANGIREVWTRGRWRRAARIRMRRSAWTSSTASTPAAVTTCWSSRRPTRAATASVRIGTALHSSFIMAGPAVQRRGSVGVISMTQIAPTLADILGVRLSPDAAAPLDLGGRQTTAQRR